MLIDHHHMFINRWNYLSWMKKNSHFFAKKYFALVQNATGYHP